MTRISVKITLMIALTAMICFSIWQAAVGISVLRGIHATSKSFAENWLPSVRALDEISLEATRYRLRGARHVMSMDAERERTIDSQMAAAAGAMRQALADYEQLSSRTTESPVWAEFKARWLEYVKMQDGVLEMSRRGDKTAAANLLEDTRDFFLAAVAKLGDEVAFHNAAAAEAVATGERDYDRALVSVIVPAVLAILFGIVVWRFVFRAATSLDQMIVAMRSIAKGDFAIDISSRDRRDEIGDMARALADVRDSLAESEILRLEQMELDFANLRMMSQAEQGLSELAEQLDAEVAQKTRALAEREREIIWRLSRATERRDTDTGDHIARMARICGIIAEALGLPDEECRLIELAAQMHDIGKVAIPDEILFKPGSFTPEERQVMETHALLGWDILKGSESRLIQTAADVAVSHHERWDGKGYPHRLAGEAIPLSGRITALADVFDALMSQRPYKRVWPIEEARAFIEENSGKHFDPTCVAAFFSRWDDIAAIAGTSASEVAASSSASPASSSAAA